MIYVYLGICKYLLQAYFIMDYDIKINMLYHIMEKQDSTLIQRKTVFT